jgi:hypothetical protein
MAKPKLIHPLSKEDDDACMARWRRTPRTRGVKLLDTDATDEQWHLARRAGIGASELASVLGVPGAYSSPFAVWWAKRLGWESGRTDAMHIGSKMEPLIGELFFERRPDIMLCRPDGRLWRHYQHDWMLATPDFLAVVEHDGDVTIEPVECKSDEGGHGWGKPGTDQIPAKHRVQLLVQCAVLGAARGHLVRLAHKRLTVYTVEALDETITKPTDPAGLDEWTPTEFEVWTDAGSKFMGSLLVATPPDPDEHKATEAALQLLYPAVDVDDDGEPVLAYVDDDLADEFLNAHDALAAATARFARARNVMRDRIGRAGRLARASNEALVAERRFYKRDGYSVGPAVVDELRRKDWTSRAG